ncbi:MAG: 16S rRNA (uracil(1498)-N(3))-methyltransferase [Verrucomicrobiae bacterium]|nr:16S rRNA (uracil(1498)-N(3))-methyltransferase [Verrucomicrobiae bacterium]
MHRFYLPPDQCRGSVLALTAREAHHGLHVLRLQPGERVGVLDGAGHEFLCEVSELGRDTVRLSVVQKDAASPLPYTITLLQAVTKSKSFDTIVQKATELGVSRIVPLLSDRVVAHLDDEKAETKLEKWRLIAIEAIKQCGSPWLPQIDAPLSPHAFLEGGEKFELSLIASLQPDSRHPREWFKRFCEERQRLPQSAAIWIGPEGDYTPAEMNSIKAAGALPITLGKLVLRSETAAIYCLSILNYELQAKYP